MPRYLSQHTLACLTRQGAVELVRQVHAVTLVQERRVLLSMQEWKMLIEFDAPDRAELAQHISVQLLLETIASGFPTTAGAPRG
ncbi:MAG: hypothetical protein WA419_11160 [Silvibacterium sp.]